MRILTEAGILKAKCYSDVFSSDKEVAKKQFRQYCKEYHPDANDSPLAQKVFARITELYQGITSGKTSSPESNIIFRNKKTNKGFELVNPIAINGGTCTIYHTLTKVALIFKKEFKKFYDSYLKNVKNVRYVDDKMEKQFSMLFPKIRTNFEDEEGNFVILLDKTAEVLNLGVIVASYKKQGIPFPERQAAWIMNRLYSMAVYMNHYGKAFNGFSINNLWVSPQYHTVLFFNGWEYVIDLGDKMIGCPKEVYHVLPIKARDTHISCSATDLECIKQIGRELFANNVATNVVKFLEDGSDDITPLEEWELYGKALSSDFGKRKFVVWDNVPYTS